MAQKNRLSKVDLTKKISDTEYKQAREDMQLPVLKASLKVRENKIPVLLLFEGWDSAGKTEAIKEFTFPMTEKVVMYNKSEKPTEEEEKYHYLARYWDRLPPKGEMGIFDRTWYSRVLVDRVEKRVTPAQWKRAYSEINSIEKMLADEGYKIIKFFLHISKKEQLKRFKERQEDPLEQHKLSDEDWRNRSKWDQYVKAYNETFAKTHFKHAPWYIVESEDRNYSRIKIMSIICEEFGINVPSYIAKKIK